MCVSGAAVAQGFPARPVRIIVDLAPGGATDLTARAAAQAIRELGQPVLVENRAGATGAVAGAYVAKSPADGHVLLLVTASATLTAVLEKDQPFSLEKDFRPVSLLVSVPYLLIVRADLPARNVEELLALARSRPGKLSFGSSGTGGGSHLLGESLAMGAGVKLLHVPYKGSAQSSVATAGGEIDMSFTTISTATPLMAAGKVRPVAVASKARVSAIGQVPTFLEAKIPLVKTSWFGMLAPAGTPADVVGRLNASLVKGMNQPAVAEMLHKQGALPTTTTPEEFGALIREELEDNARLVKALNLQPE